MVYINSMQVLSGDELQKARFLKLAKRSIEDGCFRQLVGNCRSGLIDGEDFCEGIVVDDTLYFESSAPAHSLLQVVAAVFPGVVFDFKWASEDYDQNCGYMVVQNERVMETKRGPIGYTDEAKPVYCAKGSDDVDWPRFSAKLWGDTEWLESSA